MKVLTFLGVFSLLCLGCDFGNRNSNNSGDDSAKNEDKTRRKITNKGFRQRILGSWVDHTSHIDTLIIKKDSIFSFAWIDRAPYTIDSSIISIGDGAYYNIFLLSLKDDTLIFTDQDGKATKYTRLRIRQ